MPLLPPPFPLLCVSALLRDTVVTPKKPLKRTILRAHLQHTPKASKLSSGACSAKDDLPNPSQQPRRRKRNAKKGVAQN